MTEGFVGVLLFNKALTNGFAKQKTTPEGMTRLAVGEAWERPKYQYRLIYSQSFLFTEPAAMAEAK